MQNTQTETPFDGIIGQQKAINVLSFYIEGHKKTRFMPPIFLHASRGAGKTELARRVAKSLLNEEGQPKRMIEINGSSLRGLKTFTEDILIPYVIGNQEVTLFIDEIHAVHKDVLNWLLSAIPASDEVMTRASYNGMDFDFNYNFFSFISASTNPEKLIEPLKTRMRRIELQNYSLDEIAQIIKVNAQKQEIVLKDGIEQTIAAVSRFTPRTAVFMMKDIAQYCRTQDKNSFNLKDWHSFEKIFQIMPLGIQSSELRILRKLSQGSQKLSTLAADLMLDPTTVRRDIERFLLGHGLISIDTKRTITGKGIKAMQDCEVFLESLKQKK